MDIEERAGGSGGSTPVQDEQPYSDAENQEDMDVSDDELKPSGKNARTADSDDEYVSEGGEFEREEVQRDTDDEEVEREELERHSENMSDGEREHSGDEDEDNAQNGPESPAASPSRSRSVSPAKSGSVRSRSGSPQSPVGSPMSVQKSGSDRSRSPSPAHSRCSASPARSRSRSGSPASKRSQSGSPARSRSGSPARSRSGSPARSRSGSPASRRSGSGSHRSRSGSPASQRSRSGSPGSRRSRSGSQASQRSGSRSPSRRSRSGSSGSHRSRSGSQRSGSGSRRSRSGSAASQRSRSGSRRSGSGSPRRSRSRSGSAASARSRSGSHRSRSGSPASHRSGSAGSHKSGSKSPQRSQSGSPRSHRSRSRSADSHRGSRSGSAGSEKVKPAARGRKPAALRSRSNSPVPSEGSSPDSPIVRKKKEKLFSDSESSDSESEQIKRKVRSQIQSDSEDGDEKLKNNINAISTGLESSDDEKDSGNEKKTADTPRKSHKKVLSDSEDEAPKAKESDDEDEESDKETGEKLIADIFGSSDEDEEFEGFGEADVEAAPKKKEKKTPVDDDVENSAPADDGEILPDMSDDENDENIRDSQRDDFVSDFDVMLEKKKAERQASRRKRKDVDIINDNDDLIADMVQKMKVAAEEDRELNTNKKAATKKLRYLPFVNSQLKKADLHIAFLDCGILSAMTEWLAPLPDRSLPHLTIRDCFLKILIEFPPISTDSLKSSGIGKAIMYLYKHPKETKENKTRAGKLINEWSRPIFNLTSNYSMLSKEEREERDYQQLPKRQRVAEEGGETPRRDIDKAMSQEEKALRPGDKGWVYRARVPMPSNKDYVVRPKWNVEENHPRGSSKKNLSRYEKQMRAFQEKKRRMKAQRAVTISIEGRNMSL